MDRELAEGLLDGMGRDVPDVLIQFGRALDDADVLADGWAYFLEKPYKWADEYAAWRTLGAPQLGDAEWDDFLAALDKVA